VAKRAFRSPLAGPFSRSSKAGRYHVTASYPGNGDFTGSASAARTFKVTG
jgi:hypothetical protein